MRALGEVMTAPSGANQILVLQQPVGICVLVTPWNFPAAMATRKIGPALAAGCTVRAEAGQRHPADGAGDGRDPRRGRGAGGRRQRAAGPRSGRGRVGDAARPAGPQAVVHRLDRGRAGAAEAEAADQVINSSMELGGNAPFLVFADADLDAAVDGAMVAKMRNGGEACTAANRFYVEAVRRAEFGRRLAERMAALRRRPGHRRRRPRSARWSTRRPSSKVARAGHGRGGGRGDAPSPAGRRPDAPGLFYTPTVLTGVAARLGDPRRGDLRAGRPDRRASPTRTRRSGWPTTPSTASSPTCTPATSARGMRVSEALESGMVGPQPRPGQRPCGAVRRGQAERHRPRGRPRGHARLPGVQVHRRDLVSASHGLR